MHALLIALVIVGALLAAFGAIDTYRGRMREDRDSPGMYTLPKDSPRGLIIALVGAAVSLVSGLLSLL